MKSFSKKLAEWHNPKNRDLPWKQTNDAYKIWLSEIILQQTRVEQGKPYYLAFIKQFPTIKKLGNAPLDDVLKLWEGLGYYSRARNLHIAANQVIDLYNGKFPKLHEEIIQLKGIGNYTAAAIASFAYQLPYAVVDGNVFRVLSRVFGIETPIDSTIGKKQFEQLAQDILDKKNPARHNQAIMDLGALVCKPKQPLCNECPFSSDCIAIQQNKITLLPVKTKILIKKDRYFRYLVLYNKNHIFIKQRWENDIWKGLFDFPMEESSSKWSLSQSKLLKRITYKKTDKIQKFSFRQTLSHQYINANFYEIKIEKLPKLDEQYLKISKNLLKNYAFPKIVRSYLLDRLIYLS